MCKPSEWPKMKMLQRRVEKMQARVDYSVHGVLQLRGL